MRNINIDDKHNTKKIKYKFAHFVVIEFTAHNFLYTLLIYIYILKHNYVWVGSKDDDMTSQYIYNIYEHECMFCDHYIHYFQLY